MAHDDRKQPVQTVIAYAVLSRRRVAAGTVTVPVSNADDDRLRKINGDRSLVHPRSSADTRRAGPLTTRNHGSEA